MTATCQKEIFFYDGHFAGGGGAVRYNHSIAMLLDQSSPLIFHREDAKNKLNLFKYYKVLKHMMHDYIH